MEEIKMPRLLRDFLFIGIGLTGLHLSLGSVDINSIKFDIMTIIWVTIFTSFFSYGVVSFIKDFKNGGWKAIINNIKDFFNGF